MSESKPAKKTARKTAAKKTAKKVAAPPGQKLLGGIIDVNDRLRQAMAESQARKQSTKVQVGSLAAAAKGTLELPNLVLQYLIANRYMRTGVLLDFSGSEAVGKTTILMVFAGIFARASAQVNYRETEAKLMGEDQIKRCLSSVRKESEKIYGVINVSHPRTISQWWEEFSTTTATLRGRGAYRDNGALIGTGNHILEILDTRSKLMPAIESGGWCDSHSSNMTAAATKKANDVDEARPTAMAVEYHNIMRRMPYFNGDLNVTLLTASHKNQTINMGDRRPVYMQQADEKWTSTTSGGKGWKQNPAYLFVMTVDDAEAVDITGQVIGTDVTVTCVKNSYGEQRRKVTWTLRNVYMQDTEETQQSPIDFDKCLCDLLLEKKLFGVKVSNGNYSSRELGLMSLVPEEFSQSIHASPELKDKVGSALRIAGYSGADRQLPSTPMTVDDTGHTDDGSGSEWGKTTPVAGGLETCDAD